MSTNTYVFPQRPHHLRIFGVHLQLTSAQLQIFCICLGVALATLFMMIPADSFAQTAGSAPWEGPMCQISKSLSGPVARYGAILAFAIAGLLMMFGEMGGIFKYAVNIVLGASIAIGAASWVSWMTGNSVSLGC